MIRRWLPLAAACSFASGYVFVAPTAHAFGDEAAEGRETARNLMDEGDRFVDEGRFDDALRAYQGAHAIMHVPTTGLEVARTLTTLGRVLEAHEVALEVTRMPGANAESRPFAEARREAAEMVVRLASLIPTLTVALPNERADLRVSIDGTDVSPALARLPRRVNPGPHVVRVEARGSDPVVRRVEVPASGAIVVRIDPPAASGAFLGLPPVALVGLSVAAAGVLVGGTTGLLSLGEASDAHDRCGPDTRSCDPSAQSAIDASTTLGWVSTISFAIALAGGAIATYGLVTDRSGTSGKSQTSGSVVSLGGAGLRGTF